MQNAHGTPEPRPIIERPKLALWMWLRGYKLREGAAILGEDVGVERMRRILLPFGEPSRVIPTEAEMALLVAWTRGEITPADFYPPKLSEPAAALAVA